MSELAFFDTNILIYTDDAFSPEKHARAITLFTDHRVRETVVVSLQVLQEYYAAAQPGPQSHGPVFRSCASWLSVSTEFGPSCLHSLIQEHGVA
jgi:hypothetical protein